MTTEAKRVDVQVTGPIAKGSIVVVRREQIDEADLPYVMNELRRAAGHERFLLLALVEDASLTVSGPEDLKDALRQMAKEAVDGRAE